MKMNLLKLSMVFGAMALGRPAAADEPQIKDFVVEPNANSANMIRVSVDHANHFYKAGETMTVTVKTEKDGYLYLLYTGANGNAHLLFPNEHQQENFVHAGAEVQVPAADAAFQITCRPPCGRELLQAVCTEKPLNSTIEKQMGKAIGQPTLKEMKTELKRKPARDWAEARIEITTSESDRVAPKRRVAVCVGISKFKSDRIPPLHVSDKDAQRMAAALKNDGQFDEVILLTNAEATREAIERAILKDLPQKSSSGDTIVLYFSCHGGRCADTTGDHADGLSKFLVPYDGEPGSPETMIMDKDFTRWIRELDGRDIGIILDNCFSAGMAKGQGRAKGIGGPAAPVNGHSKGLLDDVFLGKELGRAKALGQDGVMVLAACEGNQLAWEMEDEDGDSVLTCYVLKSLKDSSIPRNDEGHVAVKEVFNYVESPVKEYVKKTFGVEQNPVLIDLAKDRVVVKP